MIRCVRYLQLRSWSEECPIWSQNMEHNHNSYVKKKFTRRWIDGRKGGRERERERRRKETEREEKKQKNVSTTPAKTPPCFQRQEKAKHNQLGFRPSEEDAPAPSILYPASNLDWWLGSYMIVYMFQCHSPKSSHPCPLPQSPKDSSIHLCLFCCLAYRVIITIFLNSIYMC